MSEVVALVLLVFGWFATHLFSEARERRKELRAFLDKSLATFWKITEDAIAFHSAQEHDASKASNLVTRLHLAIRQLKRCKVGRAPTTQVAITRLRQAITLANFDKSNFCTQPPDSSILADISNAAADLEECIEGRYLEMYPSSFPYFAPSESWVLFARRIGSELKKIKG